MSEKNVKFNGFSITNVNMKRNINSTKKQTGKFDLQSENFQSDSNKLLFKVVLKISTITDKETIDISVEGYFEFDDTFEEKEISHFLKITAPSILYPYCRTFISSITGFDSPTTVLLPIVNFANSQIKKSD